MDPQTLNLARLLVAAALVAATAEYAAMIKRRALRTAHARERAMFEDDGLHGLVRVFLAGAPDLRWVRNQAPQPSSRVSTAASDR